MSWKGYPKTEGVKAIGRIVLVVDRDENSLCTPTDFPTNEELTEWIREAIDDRDLCFRDFLTPGNIDARWSDDA